MHYRRAVFLELDRSPELDVTFAASHSGIDGIEAMAPTEVRNLIDTPVTRWRGFQWQRGMVRIAARGKFDAAIFLGDWASLSTWVAAAMLRLRRIPVLFWTIGWHRPERGVRRLIRLGFYHLANGLLLYGNLGRRLGIAHGYAADRMHIVFNSTQPSPGDLTPSIASLSGSLAGQDVVGAVARLNPKKDFGLLLRAVADLKARTNRDVTVLLVGEGPARHQLLDDASALGVRLLLPGAAYSDRDLAVVYSLLKITVVPSAIGLTAVQSLAHGVPVISDDDEYSQAPEWEAIRPGDTGDVYPAGDAAALAEAIERWLRRLEQDAPSVAAACTEEVEQRWTASRQAALIKDAVLGRL